MSFSARSGEILGVIGPNGSGKTTLFACTAGTIPVSAGVVYANDSPVDIGARKQALFYVPENARPWPDQTVTWVVRFIARMFSKTDADAVASVRRLGLSHVASSRMRTLSKGEHRRVLIAMGLLSSQHVLLLDEPFDGLDLRQTRDVMRVLREEATMRAIIVSVHQLTDAARLCDRLVLLNAGRVAGSGTMDELRLASGVATGGIEEIFLALT